MWVRKGAHWDSEFYYLNSFQAPVLVWESVTRRCYSCSFLLRWSRGVLTWSLECFLRSVSNSNCISEVFFFFAVNRKQVSSVSCYYSNRGLVGEGRLHGNGTGCWQSSEVCVVSSSSCRSAEFSRRVMKFSRQTLGSFCLFNVTSDCLNYSCSIVVL